jgi:polyhydroxyalkanoate synthase
MLPLWKNISSSNLENLERLQKLAALQGGPPAAVAQTPSEVVYRENKLRLLRYQGGARTHRTPILLVPSIINRYYILDLKPGRSLAEFLVGRGYDVWILDWGIPGPEDRFVTLDEHIDGHLRECVRVVLDERGSDSLTMLGYCIGGVLATIFSALHPKTVRNLVTLTTPIDFHDEGLLSLWARREHFPVDRLIDVYGNMPAWLLGASFKLLSPTSDLANAWTLWERLDDPERLDDFRALNRWVEDNVPVAGETYRKFVRDCYQENLLVQNRMQINGRSANLGDISADLLNVVAERDHIAPCGSAAVLNELAGSQDATLLSLNGGHIGAIVGRDAVEEFWPQLDAWLAPRSGS